MIRPFHPFTQASQQPVTPNDPALYRIEIYPTSSGRSSRATGSG